MRNARCAPRREAWTQTASTMPVVTLTLATTGLQHSLAGRPPLKRSNLLSSTSSRHDWRDARYVAATSHRPSCGGLTCPSRASRDACALLGVHGVTPQIKQTFGDTSATYREFLHTLNQYKALRCVCGVGLL